MLEILFKFSGSFSGVDGEQLANPTSLQFGPDSRLYVTEQTGSIKAFTVEKLGDTWTATDVEVLVDGNGAELVKSIQNHFDDGSLKADENRQVTGIVVGGTADEPVLYISSSDPSISVRGEVNLDTNSGVVSRATFEASTGEWSVVDLMRGLPRSEENHSANGMTLSEDGSTLLLQVGGNTNNGAPSNFFSFTNEYALSGTVIEIDLDALDALPVLTDPIGGQAGTARSYVYDLPTLDDPNIENVTDGVGEDANGLDESGPWGGNDGLNQAILPADAPLRIFADGFRNAYDIAQTPNGNFYTVDNGSNTNLGAGPSVETNDQDGDGIPGEAIGTPSSGLLGEAEPLQRIVEGGYYYHANPIRSNQNQSWTVYDDSGNPDVTLDVNFVEDISELVPDGVAIAEGFLIDPSKFAYAEGVTLADVSQAELEARLLLSGTKIDRDNTVQNDPDGDGAGQQAITIVGSSTNGIVSYDSNGLAFGGSLDGALFVAQFNGNVTLLNINDAGTALNPILNSGDDGIFGTADDEVQDEDGIFSVANTGTGASLSVPIDVTVGPDGTLWIAEIGGNEITVVSPTSEVLQANTDSDGDGINNQDDPFLRDASNGTTVVLSGNQTELWDFDPNQDGNLQGARGYGGGLTGVLVNGTTDYDAFFQADSNVPGQNVALDNVKFITAAGGGTTVIENVSNGDPFKDQNAGTFLFHTGMIADDSVETTNFCWIVVNPGDSISGGFQQIGGYIGTGDQDNYLKIVASAANRGEINVVLEINGTPRINDYFQADDLLSVAAEIGRDIVFNLDLDIQTGIALPIVSYETADGTFKQVVLDEIDLSGTVIIDALLGDYTVQGQASGLAVGLFSSNNGVDQKNTFQAVFKGIEVSTTGSEGDAIYRVNAGGQTIAALDGGPDWAADTIGAPSEFLENVGGNRTAGFSVTPNDSVDDSVPPGIFATERWDNAGGNEMQYAFDVADGTYEVRLFMGNGFNGTNDPGERVFDVAIEAAVPANLDGIDLSAVLGHKLGGMFSSVVQVTDGELNIELLHDIENPLVNGIEILRREVFDTEEVEVSIVGGNQTVSEGDGSVNISMLTNVPVPVGEQLAVTYTIQGISADAGTDFDANDFLTGTTGTAVLPGGSSDFQLVIDILDDMSPEGTESFVVTLGSVSEGYGIGTSSVTVTIEDDDDTGYEAEEILNAANGIDRDGRYGANATGSAVLTILDGVENPESSNFGVNSFQLTNTGDKQVAAVVLDFRTAVFGGSVIDNDGSAGDSAAKDFTINSNGGTGGFISQNDAYLFASDDPLANTTGTGLASSGGFKGLLVKFDGTGFSNGETVGFSGDMDPNSIAGLLKHGASGVDTGAIQGWDVGGISGAELIGSTFTVMFDDGTTATGYLHSDESQSGSVGEAVEGATVSTATLTIDTGFDDVTSGITGTYGLVEPLVTVTGTPGDIVRVVLQKGFNPVTNDGNGVADLVAARLADDRPAFQVNNSFDLQTVDVMISASGSVTLDPAAFDYVGTVSGVSFDGQDAAPLAFTAAVVASVSDNAPDVLNGDDSVALGPVSEPIFLTSSGTPVDPGGSIARENLIENGDFENHGTLNRWTWGTFDEIDGWIAESDVIEIQIGAFQTANTPGNAVVELDGCANATIVQQVEDVDAGLYGFSIDYNRRRADNKSNGFDVVISGDDFEFIQSVETTNGAWQTLVFDIALAAGDYDIALVGTGISDSIGTIVDNIEFYAVADDSLFQA